MTPGDYYRARASEFGEKARLATSGAFRVQYDMLAQSYLRLAGQAERNMQTDVVYETPMPAPQAGQQPIQRKDAEG